MIKHMCIDCRSSRPDSSSAVSAFCGMLYKTRLSFLAPLSVVSAFYFMISAFWFRTLSASQDVLNVNPKLQSLVVNVCAGYVAHTVILQLFVVNFNISRLSHVYSAQTSAGAVE